MVVVAGTIPVRSDRREQAVAMMKEVAAATRPEAGCISYDFSVDLTDECVYRVFEQWESREDLARHLEAEHTRRFLGGIGAHLAQPPSVKTFDVSRVADL